MPQHRKVAPLSDAAFRLHVTAMAWCVEERTDGKVGYKIPATLTRAPSGKALRKALAELTDAGLWHETQDGYQIHDFLEWNLSAADYAAKAAAGAAGGRRSGSTRRSKSEAGASPPGSKSEAGASADAQANAKQNSNSAQADPDPDPESERENPPTPLPGSPAALRGLGFGAQHRPDVLAVRNEWMRIFRIKTHKFRDPVDFEADHVAAAIDAYGLEKCLLVLKHAPSDGMVSGRDDDKRMKHESLGYIFGNNAAFVRILRDAEERERATNDGSPASKIERLKRDSGAA